MQFLIVDDHSIVTMALGMLLKDFDGQDNTVYTANSKDEALALADQYGDTADLMILDLSMPGVEGTSLMETIVERHPTMKILVMSGLTDQHSIVKVLQMGAAGFIPKSLDAALLTAAIRFVLNGGVYIPVKLLAEAQRTSLLTNRDTQRPNVETVHLTERQKDVLALLAKGAPIKRICKELNLSEGTVKTHVTAIYRAFNATNRTEALLEARRHGFEVAL
ncbi:MAG: response regulator transcription factor [Burkholderiaceae bacterium]|jgi:DNA-binding NarL/FixJ family response regulator|nr:response regulator transcription factor [Burkholderiaceae bacterium]